MSCVGTEAASGGRVTSVKMREMPPTERPITAAAAGAALPTWAFALGIMKPHARWRSRARVGARGEGTGPSKLWLAHPPQILPYCGQLILRKISKFDATRSQISRQNAQNSISAVVPPQTPLGELTALLQTPWLYLTGLLLTGGTRKRGGG